jgi:myo-inositol-1(or 4)-monophosphatase
LGKGTQHFVRGLPFCTSMLALIEDGQVVFGAIYDFINDIMYHAEKGKGAFKNEEKISVNNLSLEKSYLCWEIKILDNEENKKKYFLLREKSILFKTIACGWEFAMIAEGKLDGRVCFDPHGKDYDYAPGSLIVAEAGGIVKNIGSTEYDYKNRNFICANPIIYNELVTGKEAIFPV